MYDYFVAAMRCPVCREVSPADSSTNMQTHLRFGADGRELAAGFALKPVETEAEHIAASGYVRIACPPDQGSATLLETWECPTCGANDLWAVIEIRGGVIALIAGLDLDRKALDRAHFISDQCFLRAAQLSGLPSADLMNGKVDPVAVLREHLPSA